MVFLFDDQKVFLPEKETGNKNIQNVKACDFIYLFQRKRHHELCFVEAKTTAPYQKNPLQEYLQQIHDQFSHALLFYMSLVLGRQNIETSTLPSEMKKWRSLKGKISLVLVVRKHKKEWLQQLQEALRNEMKGITRSFAIQDVLVVNEQIAGKFGIVQYNAES